MTIKKILNPYWNPDFYIHEKGKTFWKAYLYLVGTSLIIACGIWVAFMVFANTATTQYVTKIINAIEQDYPDNLVLSFTKNNELSSNSSSTIKFFSIKDIVPLETIPKEFSTYTHLITIDTTKDATIDAPSVNKTPVTFSRTGIIQVSDKGVEVIKYTDLEERTLTKTKLTSFTSWAKDKVVYIPHLVLTFIVVSYVVFLPVILALMCLFFGLVVRVVLEVFCTTKKTYQESYVIALYAISPALVIQYFFSMLGFAIFPFFTTLFIAVFVVIMFKNGTHRILETKG